MKCRNVLIFVLNVTLLNVMHVYFFQPYTSIEMLSQTFATSNKTFKAENVQTACACAIAVAIIYIVIVEFWNTKVIYFTS